MNKHFLLICLLITTYMAHGQPRYSVIIDEIMIDPSPSVGLPNYEWIELRNNSTLPINLQGWKLGTTTSISGAMPYYLLPPDSFLIVSSTSAVMSMRNFGSALAVTNFPSLDNDADILYLQNAQGLVIHGLSYSADWYKNDRKKEGGWSLEMINTQNACLGTGNWTASLNVVGGSPGKENSTGGDNADNTAPTLLRSYTLSADSLVLLFDRPIDSLSGSAISNYSIDLGMQIIRTATISPVFDKINLITNQPLRNDLVYEISVKDIKDCSGNLIEKTAYVKAGLPTDAFYGDVVINEIMFNPKPNGSDYIELYNASDRIIDASQMAIANRNASGAISSIKTISTRPFYIFPGDFTVITEDPGNISMNYLVKTPEQLFAVKPLPSMPDESGDILLLNFQGELVDEVRYSSDWHFKLLRDAEGVSLERLDAKSLSSNPSNWHSAASTAGYGTPGYQNSQYNPVSISEAPIKISPTIFSPDNDGMDDVLRIQYNVSAPGFVANIVIYDAAGRLIKTLVRNNLLGLSGYWNWDGMNDGDVPAPTGNYIILTELFNLEGKRARYKNAVVLARKIR